MFVLLLSDCIFAFNGTVFLLKDIKTFDRVGFFNILTLNGEWKTGKLILKRRECGWLGCGNFHTSADI